MTCRVHALRDPEPQRHTITLPPGLPLGYGYCTRCRRLIAVEAWASADPCPGPAPEETLESERERTVSMLARCARFQR